MSDPTYERRPLINTPETRSLIRGLNKLLRGDLTAKKLNAVCKAIKDGKIPETVEEAEAIEGLRYELTELEKRATHWAAVLSRSK